MSKLQAFYTECTPKGSSSGALKVYVPVAMNIMGMSKAAPTKNVTIPSAMFTNASNCRPGISGSIVTQNYITAMAPYEPYELPMYPYGGEIEVETDYTDVLTCRIRTADIDNSVKP